MVSQILFGLLVAAFGAAGVPLVIGADDTLERRRGEKIRAKGVFRDPVRSSRKYTVHAYGLRWVSMMVLVPVPWSSRLWALPFLTVLAASEATNQANGKRHKTVIDWIMQMVCAVRRWQPQASIVLVTDGGLSAVKLGLRCYGFANPITWVSRLRLDAVLHDWPEPQTTHLSLDANGYLATVVNPAGETTHMDYTDAGLMISFTTPVGHTSTFTYTSQGRLTRDEDAAGGSLELSRSQVSQGYAVAATTALSRATTYQVVTDNLDNQTRANTLPGGLRTEQVVRMDGTRRWQAANGAVTNATLGPDPRWGMLAPIDKTTTITTPGGLNASMTSQRTATLAQAGNPFSLITQQETFTFNGRTYTSNYDAATRTFTDISPAGRQQTMVIDSQGRPTFVQAAGLASLSYTYDSQGRLIAATQGGGVDARTATFTYNGDGYLASATDPLGRTVSFAYDLAGRVAAQTLPDGRVVSYAYDASGNLTLLTPPGRPAHSFTYTPVDLQASYTPPDIGIGDTATSYAYNLDRQLTRVTRPDGKSIDVGYDFAGRPHSLTFSRGSVAYAYHPTTGNLVGILAPDGVSLTLGYDGGLLTAQNWSGPVAGSVGYTYDNNFRRTAITVNGANAIASSYDNDSLLTGVGGLSLSRNAQNGLLTGSTLGGVTEAFSYNGFS
jgi:YD repeat-containing protein